MSLSRWSNDSKYFNTQFNIKDNAEQFLIIKYK